MKNIQATLMRYVALALAIVPVATGNVCHGLERNRFYHDRQERRKGAGRRRSLVLLRKPGRL